MERRLARLEAATDALGNANQHHDDSRLAFLYSLPDDEAEAELDWIIPNFFCDLVRGGDCVTWGPVVPGSPFASDSDFSDLWDRWTRRWNDLRYEEMMGQ